MLAAKTPRVSAAARRGAASRRSLCCRPRAAVSPAKTIVKLPDAPTEDGNLGWPRGEHRCYVHWGGWKFSEEPTVPKGVLEDRGPLGEWLAPAGLPRARGRSDGLQMTHTMHRDGQGRSRADVRGEMRRRARHGVPRAPRAPRARSVCV